jgi:hypothetical protein
MEVRGIEVYIARLIDVVAGRLGKIRKDRRKVKNAK